MIIRSLCNTCFQQYEIFLGPDPKTSTAMLSQVMDDDGLGRCPRGCGGRVNLANDPTIDKMKEGVQLKDPMHLSMQEFYQATYGMPLPDELPTTKESVEDMLLAHRIVKIEYEEHLGRKYIHELHLDNNCIIHLCAGGRGAQLLKITRMHEQAEEPT